MEKLKALWTALRPDLKLHIIAGALISWIGSYIALVLFNITGGINILSWITIIIICGIFGAALGAIVGWLKEYKYDANHNGTVDRNDFLYTGRAAIIAAIVWCIILLIAGAIYNV